MFEESEFEQAVDELKCPKLEKWEFFVETLREGVHCKIYRQYDEVSGLYSYKMYGNLECEPETCYQVYLDLEYRKKWDDYVKELCEFNEDNNGSNIQGIYWNVNFPFPLSNRDVSAMYTFVRDSRKLDIDGITTYAVLGKSYPFSSGPKTSGAVRVSEFTQSLVLQSDEKNNTKAYMYYFDNPGGMIPTWLINWAAKNIEYDTKLLKTSYKAGTCTAKGVDLEPQKMHADPLTEEDEAKLLDMGVLGFQSSEALSYTVFFYNCKIFAFRGMNEHVNLTYEQFEFREDGRISKNVQGGLSHTKVDVKRHWQQKVTTFYIKVFDLNR